MSRAGRVAAGFVVVAVGLWLSGMAPLARSAAGMTADLGALGFRPNGAPRGWWSQEFAWRPNASETGRWMRLKVVLATAQTGASRVYFGWRQAGRGDHPWRVYGAVLVARPWIKLVHFGGAGSFARSPDFAGFTVETWGGPESADFVLFARERHRVELSFARSDVGPTLRFERP